MMQSKKIRIMVLALSAFFFIHALSASTIYAQEIRSVPQREEALRYIAIQDTRAQIFVQSNAIQCSALVMVSIYSDGAHYISFTHHIYAG